MSENQIKKRVYVEQELKMDDFGPYSNTPYIGDVWKPEDFHVFFSQKTTNMISEKVTEALMGVHPEGKRIVVPDETILMVQRNIYDNERDNVWIMIDMVIDTIYTRIRDEFGINEQNEKLNKWIVKHDETMYEMNPYTPIRSYAPLKIRERTTQRSFMYNY